MPVVERVNGREILDSRGRPTVLAMCRLKSGYVGSASVPSGASTGSAEVVEKRDGDPHRYRGLGCRLAVKNINETINDHLAHVTFAAQSDLDQCLLNLDGTSDKSALGANAILAVSVAFARAAAAENGIPLWRYFANLLKASPGTLPRLTINLFSGGKHGGGQVAIQDVLLVPAGASSIDTSLSATYDVYQSAAELIRERYSMRMLRADEGGLAPPCKSSEEMIQLALESIERAGYVPGHEFCLAVDVAASQFYANRAYTIDGVILDSPAMVDRLKSWVNQYPIISIEDGLAENDWEHWPLLKSGIGSKCLVVGDDLLCTNQARIQRAIDLDAANALLLKVNQVGTLTEAARGCLLARGSNWQVTVSVRSGETEDDWAADLAVGWSADQFKNGSITQSERLAKYNRLLEIESQAKWPVKLWPNVKA
jgi:enolase 1/2/3